MTKKYTVRINQIHIAVGIQITKDLTGVVFDDTVECGTISIGLVEVDGRVFTDIKTVPFGNKIIGRLMNVHHVGALLNRCLSMRDTSACW